MTQPEILSGISGQTRWRVAAKTSSDIDLAIGRRVKLRRRLLQMSQQELASQLGITFQQLQKYEKGRNRIGAGRLFEIAEILEIPLTFFFEDAVGDNPISGDADVARAGMKILRSFSKIKDPATRKSIADLVEQLAERSDVSRSGR